MSWTEYERLIDERNDSPDDWAAAAKGNPCTPADALKVAVLKICSNHDMVAMDYLCQIVTSLAEQAVACELETEENQDD